LTECATPLPVDKLSTSEYLPETYAVKIVRSDDSEKITAHLVEYNIL